MQRGLSSVPAFLSTEFRLQVLLPPVSLSCVTLSFSKTECSSSSNTMRQALVTSLSLYVRQSHDIKFTVLDCFTDMMISKDHIASVA